MTWVSTMTPVAVCQDLACDATGSLFTLPTGHTMCIDCTSAYISWLLDGYIDKEPDKYAFLDRVAPAGVS
jgi:hypothetical protein